MSKRKPYALIFHLLFPKIHTFKRSLKKDHSYCSMVDRKITFFEREREGIMNVHGEVTHEIPQGFICPWTYAVLCNSIHSQIIHGRSK